jgi:hypothetical protein
MLLGMPRGFVLASPLLVGAVWVTGACGSGLRSAVAFSGRPQGAVVSAEQVRELSALPAGYEPIGQLQATCRLTEGQRRLRGEWLSDVDCGVPRLLQALRERAAEVGGELLIGRRCASQIHRRALGQRDVSCRATVARPTAETRSSRPLGSGDAEPTQAPADALPRASEAWRIQVDFTPADEHALRPAQRPDLVNELAYLPVTHVRLGDIVTRCEQGCSELATRDGLRTVGGLMGATDVVDVHCVSRASGFVCTATAAGYQVDPRTDPRAR